MANTGIKEILCENTLVFLFYINDVYVTKIPRRSIRTTTTARIPRMTWKYQKVKNAFPKYQNLYYLLFPCSLLPGFCFWKIFSSLFHINTGSWNTTMWGKEMVRVRIICSLLMWSSILVTISPCCSTSIARSMNMEWISVMPSSNFLMSLCLSSNQSDLTSKAEF